MKPLIVLLIVMACGCTAPRQELGPPSPDLPRTALPAEEGVGRLFFQSPEDGVIYVFDSDTTDVLFHAPIKQHQRFILDPQNSRATIEGKPVFEKPIDKKHGHRIYLDPHGKLPKPASNPS